MYRKVLWTPLGFDAERRKKRYQSLSATEAENYRDRIHACVSNVSQHYYASV